MSCVEPLVYLNQNDPEAHRDRRSSPGGLSGGMGGEHAPAPSVGSRSQCIRREGRGCVGREATLLATHADGPCPRSRVSWTVQASHYQPWLQRGRWAVMTSLPVSASVSPDQMSQRTHTVSGTVNHTLFSDGDQTSASGTRLGRFLMDFSPLKAPLSDISGRKRVRQPKSQISHPRRSERSVSGTPSSRRER